MTLMRMPLTVWAWFVTAILSLLAFCVLLAGGILLLLDRSAGTSFFLPAGLVVNDQVAGAQRRLAAALAASVLVLRPSRRFTSRFFRAWALSSHVLANFSRKPVSATARWRMAICAIGFLGFLVWGHHMFVSGMSPYSGLAFSVLTMSIGVPSAIKTFNWLGTLWGGKIQFKTPMLFAIGFVSLFVTGGLSGIFLAQPALDNMLHATYYVVAHFHIVMGVAAIFGIFAATYYWFPKMFGRMMSEPLGKLHFWLTFVGTYCIFMPMHFIGIVGGIATLCGFCGADLSAPRSRLCTVHDHRGVCHGRGPADFLLEFLSEPEKRREGSEKSVERDDARMDHGFASSPRQFRRRFPERLSRAVRIQRSRCEGGFHSAESRAGRWRGRSRRTRGSSLGAIEWRAQRLLMLSS